MVFCTYCGQSFTRDEHLERHILTHTNVKPFKCFTCHMSFARRDLLQRHYTVHGRDQNNQEGLPPSNGIIPKSAGRTPIACSNCAKTKTKCDKKFPCSRCASRNLRCTLRPTRRVSKNANRIPNPPEAGASGDSSEGVSNEADSASKVSPQPQVQQPSPGEPQQNQTLTQTQSEHTQSPPSAQNITPEELPGLEGTTPFFEQSSPNNANPHNALPVMLSPISTPVNGFVQHTPISGYDDFIKSSMNDGSENGSTPPFMMDWTQLHLAGFDAMARPDLMITAEMSQMGLDINGIPTNAHADGILTMIPELAHALPPVATPIATPRLDGAFSDLELGSSTTPVFYPSRNTSISDMTVPDLGAIIAAQEAWTVFRCTPPVPSSACPRTAKLNLEKLEKSLRNHEGWSNWTPSWDEADFTNGKILNVIQLQENGRDKLLAITQSFLHKALEIHKEGGIASPTSEASPSSTGSNFVLLPPARVLEYFLRSYANTFERYFPMSSRGVLNANELLLQCSNDKASSLLVLLMIAQGAMAIPSIETRWLTGGLTEACRISLFDLIEKNIIMASDPTVLHSALLFTVQAAWSGDKWQMDIAMGQRGMYFAMLRHSGILEPRYAPAPSQAFDHLGTSDGLWAEWIQHESRSRLIYCWVMVDQDLSLFHDTAPLFSVTEFGTPMPDSDCLWQAGSVAEWSEMFNQVHEFSGGYSSIGSGARPLPLRDLFRHFLDDEIISQGIELTPLHLRLLLHPLQSLVCQYCQLLSCFSDNMASRQRPRAVTAASTRARLEEVQALLQRWNDLANRYLRANAMCAMMQANLIVFHLVCLNAVTNLSEIERLARRESVDGTYQQLLWMHKRCVSDVEESIFHCGQVLRLIRSMARGIRPPWWPAAIYRVALILWANSLTHNQPAPTQSATATMYSVPGSSSFAVDGLPADHQMIVRFVTKREGVPTLTKLDGSQLLLDNPFAILNHCIEVIDEGLATRFSDGIRRKLEKLSRV